jgi:arylsulfatase
MGGFTELHIVNLRNRSWSLTSQVVVPEGGANGVILKIGGHVGGWSFYFKDRRPTYCYNFFGIDRSYVRGTRAVPAGEHQVRMEFAYAGGGLGKSGIVTPVHRRYRSGVRPDRAHRAARLRLCVQRRRA